jgi:hypothetical protein
MQLLEKLTMLLEWFPNKEELIFFEELAKKQQRIYPDAADYGILLNRYGIQINRYGIQTGGNLKDQARNNLMKLMTSYGYKQDKWSNGTTTKIFIPIEIDEGLYSGETLIVSFNKLGNKEFLSVDIGRVALTKDQAKERWGAKF